MSFHQQHNLTSCKSLDPYQLFCCRRKQTNSSRGLGLINICPLKAKLVNPGPCNEFLVCDNSKMMVGVQTFATSEMCVFGMVVGFRRFQLKKKGKSSTYGDYAFRFLTCVLKRICSDHVFLVCATMARFSSLLARSCLSLVRFWFSSAPFRNPLAPFWVPLAPFGFLLARCSLPLGSLWFPSGLLWGRFTLSHFGAIFPFDTLEPCCPLTLSSYFAL